MTTYARILAAALSLAGTKGLAKLTRDDIAKRAKVAPGLVSYHFDGMTGLRTRVVESAIQTDNYPVIAAAILLDRPEVKDLPDTIRKRALLSVA